MLAPQKLRRNCIFQVQNRPLHYSAKKTSLRADKLGVGWGGGVLWPPEAVKKLYFPSQRVAMSKNKFRS